MVRRVGVALALLLALSSVATAQTPAPGQDTMGQTTQPATGDQTTTGTQPAAADTMATDENLRPATTTWFGDTGLWFVPTGEILPHRRFSTSLYRANFDRETGFTDVSYWPITFAVGIRDRAELFASWRAVVRIDRDVRPIFSPSLTEGAGGMYWDHPFVREGWTGNDQGDLYLGAKFNILSEYRQAPAAVAFRAMLKIPTGDEEEGSSTGSLDGLFDLIVSKEVNERVELAGFGGILMRGDPDGADLPHSFRWGFGAGFPSRAKLRLTTELHGEIPFDNEVSQTRGLVATDGSIAALSNTFDGPVDATIGLTWQARNGFFAGAGLNWNMRYDGRSEYSSGFDDETGDALGFQMRIGYHPGVRYYVPPPPPPPPPPPAPENRPPTVKAQCNPCTIEVCKTSQVTATASDPDGDPLTYRWSAPTGTLANPSEVQTIWTAPCEPGPVPVTVTVDDGKGGTASDTVTIQVIRPAVKEFVFEDVHFDFDRYNLRPDAARVLDEALKAMQENAGLNIEVEGHTCNIGTAEYNLALGERRAQSVRDYLTQRGVTAGRLRTVSYGEERPKHDNSREETRRLNRRAALVVRITQ